MSKCLKTLIEEEMEQEEEVVEVVVNIMEILDLIATFSINNTT
jgi:hypothetical protein